MYGEWWHSFTWASAAFDVKQRQLFPFLSIHVMQSAGDCALISVPTRIQRNGKRQAWRYHFHIIAPYSRWWKEFSLYVSDIYYSSGWDGIALFVRFTYRIHIMSKYNWFFFFFSTVNENAFNFKNDFVLFFRFFDSKFIYLLDVLESLNLIKQLVPTEKMNEGEVIFFFHFIFHWMNGWTVRNRNEWNKFFFFSFSIFSLTFPVFLGN